ncbi:hypothetical protein D3C80_1689410 [compost metagenome]
MNVIWDSSFIGLQPKLDSVLKCLLKMAIKALEIMVFLPLVFTMVRLLINWTETET